VTTLVTVVFAIVATLAAAAAAAILFWVRSLATGQRAVCKELEEVAASQRRILEKFHSLAHRQRILSRKIEGEARADAERGVDREHPEDSGEKQAVKEDVLFMAKRGLDAAQIARDLGIPRGEVELILDLHRFGSNH